LPFNAQYLNSGSRGRKSPREITGESMGKR